MGGGTENFSFMLNTVLLPSNPCNNLTQLASATSIQLWYITSNFG